MTKGSLHLHHSTSLRFLSAAPPKNPGKLIPELFRQQLSKDKLYKCSRKIRKTILWVLISGQRIPRTRRSSSLGLEVRAFQKLIHKAESSQFSSEASKCFRKWRIVRKKKHYQSTRTHAHTHTMETHSSHHGFLGPTGHPPVTLPIPLPAPPAALLPIPSTGPNNRPLDYYFSSKSFQSLLRVTVAQCKEK